MNQQLAGGQLLGNTPPRADLNNRRAAVLGSPIEHSLSPVLHRTAYKALGFSGWRYDSAECDEFGLAPFLAALGPEWVGLSITSPLKRVALEIADQASSLTTAVGAANTLVRTNEGWRANNTDVGGMLDALKESGVRRAHSAVILGAGGTAQAALAALRKVGVYAPTVLVRDPNRTTELRAAAVRLEMEFTIKKGLDNPAVYDADLVISTVPRGAADVVARRGAWPREAVIFDVVYDPWPTPLAAAALAGGCTMVSGLDLLLYQAARQVWLMTGQRAPLEEMRAALRRAIS